MCVYVCTSEPVPNESFTGSSTSGHSSTQEGTGSMCLCVCAHVCVNEWQKCRPIEFVFILLFVLSKKCEWLFATATHREPISVNLLIYYSFLKKKTKHSVKILTWWRLIPAWTAPPHHAKSQLSVSASYQTLKFRWNPMLPSRNWKRYTPTLWVSFPGRWIVNDLCCHAVWLCKNHNPWREGDTHTPTSTHKCRHKHPSQLVLRVRWPCGEWRFSCCFSIVLIR